MKRLHPLSFVLGFVAGLIVLYAGLSIAHRVSPSPQTTAGRFQQTSGPGLARMAERLGMSQDDLQKEMAAGKTFQQIAQEHGVTLNGGFGRRTGSGAVRSGSGSLPPPATEQ